MSNQVIEASEKMQKEIIQHYQKYQIERKAPGVIFAAKLSDVTITAYRSGKILFQGAGADREAQLWNTNTSASNKPMNSLPPHLSELSVVGSDETGTGDFFGPVTVAACYIQKDQIQLIKQLGVKDSKLLTDHHMLKIAPHLKELVPHKILTLRNEKYNEIQGRGWSQGKIKAYLHNQAIKLVLEQLSDDKPDYILIDQFAEPKVYYRHLQEVEHVIKEHVIFATKAEQIHVSVAAASILARVAFLDEMERLSTIVGEKLPKGAGSKVDEVAAKLLLRKGEQFLQSVTKKHFANTGKAKSLAQKRNL